MDDFYLSYLRFVLALIFVLGLIVFVGWLARRFSPGRGLFSSIKNRERRLAVLETLPLDSRRRLVLIRRDGKQHLLLIGGQTDMMIEQGIDFLSLTEEAMKNAERNATAVPAPPRPAGDSPTTGESLS